LTMHSCSLSCRPPSFHTDPPGMSTLTATSTALRATVSTVVPHGMTHMHSKELQLFVNRTPWNLSHEGPRVRNGLTRHWGWEALGCRADLREQVCPRRVKSSHSSRPPVYYSSDDCSPLTPLQLPPSTSAREPCPSRRKSACTPKPIKVSTGNRVYADVIRQRLKLLM
jgi:hypothetical protein